ncbi:hypothetical protein FXO38_16409 [Capsicum annuum]|nr:hypothetical protein FXO38_16409 [Capsicum annuum]
MVVFPASLVSSAFEIHGDCNLLIAGTSEKKSTSVIEMPSMDLKTTMGITQALRLQMEVQKQLHEQLEIQRKLQLQIEEQGKYLEMMFERTKDIGKDLNVSSSITDEHPSPSTETKHSPPNDKSEALEKDPVSSNNCSSSSLGGKSPDKKVREDHDSDGGDSCCSPPSKRARTEERGAAVAAKPWARAAIGAGLGVRSKYSNSPSLNDKVDFSRRRRQRTAHVAAIRTFRSPTAPSWTTPPIADTSAQ